jgi:hypothetical protein
MEGPVGSMIRDLAERATIRLHHAGGLQLIAAADAPAFLEACLTAHCQILGIEGFEILDGEVRPEMEAIADFSEIDDPDQTVAEARRFLDAVEDQELAFEFTIVGEDDD